MRYALFIVLLSCSVAVFAQQQFITPKTQEREKSLAQNYDHYYWWEDAQRDTLLLENGTPVLFLRTPIRHIEGYTGLFKIDTDANIAEAIQTMQSGINFRGYTMTWQLKDGKLYLKQVWWPGPVDMFTMKGGKVEELKGPDVSPETIKQRVEALTQRKFGSDGLLLADWMTERVRVVIDDTPAIQKTSAGGVRSDESRRTYELDFNEGKLMQACEVKKTSVEGIHL